MDRKEVEKHIRQISKIKTDMIVDYMNYLLDVKEILTPAQREKIKQLKKRRTAEGDARSGETLK